MIAPKPRREPRGTPERNDKAMRIRQLRTDSARARVLAETDRYNQKMMRESASSPKTQSLLSEANKLNQEIARLAQNVGPGDRERIETAKIRFLKRYSDLDRITADRQKELFKYYQHLQRARIAKLETRSQKAYREIVESGLESLKRQRADIQKRINQLSAEGITLD